MREGSTVGGWERWGSPFFICSERIGETTSIFSVPPPRMGRGGGLSQGRPEGTRLAQGRKGFAGSKEKFGKGQDEALQASPLQASFPLGSAPGLGGWRWSSAL